MNCTGQIIKGLMKYFKKISFYEFISYINIASPQRRCFSFHLWFINLPKIDVRE